IILTLFFYHLASTTEIYTLSLHDALPIFTTADSRIKELIVEHKLPEKAFGVIRKVIAMSDPDLYDPITKELTEQSVRAAIGKQRSEEHTSELQSRFDLVCRLLLEKKKPK